jgi:hypothetical protein
MILPGIWGRIIQASEKRDVVQASGDLDIQASGNKSSRHLRDTGI